MFSRASNATHICLRCQLQLRKSQRPLSNAPFLGRTTNPRRYQSAAAVQIDEEDAQPITSPLRPTDTLPAKRGSFKKKQKKKLSKTWRPSPTAPLGMDALGKPSEVLLLTPRDRKIPFVPTGHEEEPKESFYESVASERDPTTWEQIKENITHARQQVQQQRGTLTPETWSKLKRVLSAGFTLKQLRKYLEDASTPQLQVKWPLKAAGKDPIIKIIAKHIWNYELPQVAQAAHGDKKRGPEKQLALHPYKKEQQIAMLRNPITNIRKIALENGVKISFKEQRTVVSGPAEQAKEVRKILQQQVATLKKVARPIPSYVKLLEHESEMENLQILVETLAQKYGVYAAIAGQSTNLQVRVISTASNQSSVDRLLHELSLTLEREGDNSISMSNLATGQKVSVMAHYSSDSPDQYPSPKALFRARSMSNSKASMPPELIAKFVHKKLLFENVPTETSGRVRFECKAEFGTALFDQKSEPALLSQGSSQKDSSPYSTFIPEVPFLPYLLASGSLQPNSTISSTLTTRLCFTSLDQRKYGEVIEVDLLSTGHQLNFGKDLCIQRISTVKREIGLNLLQPTLPVDIKLTCRHEMDLYDSTSPLPSELHQAVSNYLTSFKGRKPDVDEVPAAVFPLFVDLPVSPNIQRQSSAKKTSKKTDDKHTADKTTSRSYFLSDFSIVDTTCYDFEHKSHRYTLEHINYIAQNPNASPTDMTQGLVMPSPFRDRQALMIRFESPIASQTLAKVAKVGKQKVAKATKEIEGEKAAEKATFEKFLGAALWVARKIGEEGNKLRLRMESMK